ncbi:hypothetical protein ABW20_dc0110517 [Dactylellina cionopaga]|nr:hypothetical protein ABW20_dc0110517 [Dactylellina cionopaga]
MKTRGVNAGGWLVLEPWITPSLWSQWNSNPAAGPVDEFHLCQKLGKTACTNLLKNHWNTFFTESDFQQMAANGLNTVRIPIGWWAFDSKPSPFIGGQAAYLDKAIVWARKYGLKVWIDLHGAPGSQNGFDNSGYRDRINWQSTVDDNVGRTVAVLRTIAQKYGGSAYNDVVVVIELLNEPMGPKLDLARLRKFMYDAFGNVRQYSPAWVVFSDAFEPVTYWNRNNKGSFFEQNVILDHHHYQVFSPGELSRTFQQQIDVACSARGSEISGVDKLLIVGEWSGAMTDCAKWLNGFNRGARWEGKFDSSWLRNSCANWGDLSKMTAVTRDQLNKYLSAQMLSWETQGGWIFWTWKAEEGNRNDDWNMSKLFSWGIIRKITPSGQRLNLRHPDVCG